MILGIDIDDTIANTHDVMFTYAEKYIIEDLKKEITISTKKELGGNGQCERIHCMTKDEGADFWKKYFVKIVLELPIKPFAKDIIKKLKDAGNTIILITSRFNTENENVKKATEVWLEKNEIPYDKLIFNAPDKCQSIQSEKINIFIDDAAPTCLKVADLGVKALMMNSIENQLTNDSRITRIQTWLHAYQEIKKYDNNQMQN